MIEVSQEPADGRNAKPVRSWPEPAGLVLGPMIAAAFGLSVDELCSARRGSADVSFARQVAMYLAHTHMGFPFAVAGRLFRRDRTTARHACRQVEERREDPRVDALLGCLERALDASSEISQFHTGRRSYG